jgi:aminomethyltransferase
MLNEASSHDLPEFDLPPGPDEAAKMALPHADLLERARLAHALHEYRVSAGTARTLRVAAGQYVQVIDVEGRQCSDLLAFDAAALDRGETLALDPAVTRTLMGRDTPQPGLHAKYYDSGMQPMLEVVQDTVGRHDSFALACTRKYYDDAGYPGHDSCSENFNAVLAPHGIASRPGWTAVNFFFNTRIEPCGTLVFDEPWSRAGDYVLLRASRDLLLAVSSCADDIDAANGWQPTDILVRVYDTHHSFPSAIAHRMTADAPPRLTRESAFAPRTRALAQHFVDYRGFWLPHEFTDHGAMAEYWACRERVAVMDLSALRKFDVSGPDAEALLGHVQTRDIRKLAPGQVVYTAVCHPHGGMMDDATVFRLGVDNFRFVCGEDTTGLWLEEQARALGLKVFVRNVTDRLHNIALQGPASRAVLEQVMWTPPARSSATTLKWFRFTVGRIGSAQGAPVIVSRTGYTGELGFELWCHPSDAGRVWDAVWEAGIPHGIAPLGMAALDMLRIEAGLAFAGQEFCPMTDPFEAGIGFCVALDQPSDFVGKEALASRARTPRNKLVGLVGETAEALASGDIVYHGREEIGYVTSATRSPSLGRQIALARLDVLYAQPGSRFEIGKLDGKLKRLPVEVVPFPHYDPTKSRVRS